MPQPHEEEALQRLKRAQAAYDRAKAVTRSAPPDGPSRVAAFAALREAEEELRNAGRALSKARSERQEVERE